MADPRTRFWILAAGGAAIAMVVGAYLADGRYAPALAVGLLTGLVVMHRWFAPGVTGLMLGGLLIGNIVGNRGFAQLMPFAPLPLLPAELGLALGTGWLFLQGARARRLPLRLEPLGLAILAWVVLSSLRLPVDVRTHGFFAVRDYALVYYAGFYFVALEAAETRATRRWLRASWTGALLLLAGLYPLYEYFMEFFLIRFTFQGSPLIAIKNDLAGTFVAAGAMYAAVRWGGERHRLRWGLMLVVCLGLALYMVTRAAFVGMLVTVVCFMPGARLKVVQSLGVLLILGGALTLAQTAGGERTWQDTRLYDVYEHALSLTDFSGQRAYVGVESQDTGDNTQFRRIWWRLLIDRTIDEHLWTGAGFGADISSEFARDYLGAGAGDFTARSPHNVVLTVFARSGLAGLLPFLAVAAMLVRETWRGLPRGPDPDGGTVQASALRCAAWVIFISACFGVVLEGPMGAVVFWILLGVAQARPQVVPDDPDLQNGKSGSIGRQAPDKPWHDAPERPYRRLWK